MAEPGKDKKCILVTTATSTKEIEDLMNHLKAQHSIPNENLQKLQCKPATKHDQAAFLPALKFSNSEAVFIGWGQIIPSLKGQTINECSILDY